MSSGVSEVLSEQLRHRFYAGLMLIESALALLSCQLDLSREEEGIRLRRQRSDNRDEDYYKGNAVEEICDRLHLR